MAKEKKCTCKTITCPICDGTGINSGTDCTSCHQGVITVEDQFCNVHQGAQE